MRLHVGLGFVAFGRDDGEVHAHAGGAEHERMGDIVAVADVATLETRKPPLAFEDGEQVGHDLTGVLVVG